MSEDSDYTSDIFPSQHQNNMSAHQIPRERSDRAVPNTLGQHNVWTEDAYTHGDAYYPDDSYYEQTPTASDMHDMQAPFHHANADDRYESLRTLI